MRVEDIRRLEEIAEDVDTHVAEEIRAIVHQVRAETLACAHCDVDSPGSLADALNQGWTRLQTDHGVGWNFLGVCPQCKDK